MDPTSAFLVVTLSSGLGAIEPYTYGKQVSYCFWSAFQEEVKPNGLGKEQGCPRLMSSLRLEKSSYGQLDRAQSSGRGTEAGSWEDPGGQHSPTKMGDTHHLRAQDRLQLSFLEEEFYRPAVSYWLLSGPKCTADPSFDPLCFHQDCLTIYSDIHVTVSTDQ